MCYHGDYFTENILVSEVYGGMFTALELKSERWYGKGCQEEGRMK